MSGRSEEKDLASSRGRPEGLPKPGVARRVGPPPAAGSRWRDQRRFRASSSRSAALSAVAAFLSRGIGRGR